jgi:hypothetical protein
MGWADARALACAADTGTESGGGVQGREGDMRAGVPLEDASGVVGRERKGVGECECRERGERISRGSGRTRDMGGEGGRSVRGVCLERAGMGRVGVV